MYHVRLYIVEKIGFGTASKQCGIRSKPQPLLQKNRLSYTFETLAAYTGTCLRMHTLARICKLRATLINSFPKIDF